MSEFAMWGPQQSGVRLAEDDIRKQQAHELEAAEMMGKLAMMPDRQRLLQAQADTQGAHARLYGAQADEAARESQARARLSEAMQRVDLEGLDAEEATYEMGRVAARSGSLTGATQAMQRGAQIATQRAHARQYRSMAEKADIESNQKELSIVEGVLRGSTDQASLDRNNQLYELMTGRPSPLSGMTYSKQGLSALTEATISAKDKLNLKLKELEERGRASGRAETARFHREQADIAREGNEIKRARLDRVNKVGAPPVASEEDRRQARQIIKASNMDGLDPASLDDAAIDIASRARQIRRGNPAVEYTSALQMAFNEMKGDFETSSMNVLGFDINKKTKYSTLGKRRENPLQLPEGADPAVRAKALKRDRWYDTPRGLLQYLGNGKWTDGTDTEEDDD